MKTLYLLRHAHTLADPPAGGGDHERHLSPQGMEDARRVGRFMTEQGLTPDLVLVSTATRTQQTAELAFGQLAALPPVRLERGLYHASAGSLLSFAQGAADNIHTLMIVSHNPGAAELALRLGDVEHYAPGTLSVFVAGVESWRDFSMDTTKLAALFEP